MSVQDIETYEPTPEEAARRRKRSVAIAMILLALMTLVFVTTIVRLGGMTGN
jgi:hypothetical protein